MQHRALELRQRALRFAQAVQAFARGFLEKRQTKRLAQRLGNAVTAVDKGYRDVSAAECRDAFIAGMSCVVRNAKRARVILQDFVALKHATIEDVRSLILEARGLEAIFRASLNTARRRRKAQLRRASNAESGSTPGANRLRAPRAHRRRAIADSN